MTPLLLIILAGAGAGLALAQTQSSAPVQPVASRLTQAIDEKALVPLKGTVHALANARNDAGVAEDGMALQRIQVLLQRSPAQETALQQMIQDMHTPGTAGYHKWLTPEQFGQQFGPSDADVATLTAWLAKQGFTVTKVNAGKQTLEMSGSVAQFRTAFHTQIHKYRVNGELHYANASDPQIPAALAPVFGGFASLNNFPLKSHMKTLGTAQLDSATHKVTPNWTTGPAGYVPNFILTPGDFAVQYDLNPLYTAGVTGTGQTIAIINEANVNPVLVNQYRTLFGLPTSTLNVIIDGNDPGIDGINNPDGPNGASGEAYLDVEQSGAIAPGAQIDLVIGADTALASGLELAAEHAVYSNVAPVLSLSFGSCEGGEGQQQNQFWGALWEQAAAQGQTAVVSTGDSGSASCDQGSEYASYGQTVSGLASTPYNVAVGGTDFYYTDYATDGDQGTGKFTQLATYWNQTTSNATPTVSILGKIPEQPWNDSQFGLNYLNYYFESSDSGTTTAAGSGGASNCATGIPTAGLATGGTCAGVPKPTWQAGTGVPADSVRDLPDVSLFASNGENFSYYPICASDGDCQAVAAGNTLQITGVGGTSASTPAFAAIMALVNQKYGRQGQADYVLYPLAKQFPTAFNDVVAGTNTVPCAYGVGTLDSPNCIGVTSPLTITDPNTGASVLEGEIGTGTTPDYAATTGYDLASGLGTIDANNLVTNWGNVKFTTSTVTLTPSQTTFAHGTSVTISGTVTPGTATGSVALETTSTEPNQTAQGLSQLLSAAATVFPLTNGAFSGSVSSLPGGTYTIFGSYGGDGVNGPSTSTPVSITVTPEASTLLLQALSQTGAAVTLGTSVPYGTQLLLSGQAYPTSCYVATSPTKSCATTTVTKPTGTVTFLDGATSLNVATVNASGDAEYNAAFALGTHSVTANYSGDNSYNASNTTGTPLAFTVVKDTPDVGLTSSAQPYSTTAFVAIPGQSTLTVQILNSANDTLVNQGAVTYVPVAAPTGTVTLTGLGSGTLTFPVLQSAVDAITGANPGTGLVEGVGLVAVPAGLAAGNYNITIAYSGDTNYNATSATTTLQVGTVQGATVPTTTSATASQTSTSVTAATTVAVTVTGTTTGGAPAGQAGVFAPGGYLVGLANLTAGTGGTSTASVIVNSETLIEGTNTLTVEYFPGSTSTYEPSFATVTIQNGGTSVSPTSSTIALTNSAPITIASPGASGSSTITVTPGGGFTGSVSLSCAVAPTSLNDVPTCTLSTPAAITGTTPVTATLTVATTAASASLERPRMRMLPLGGGAVAATLLFFLVPVRRRRWTTLLGALVLMVTVGFSAGCGGGTTQTQANPGTATGTYTVTVTGTGTGAASATTTVSVTVN